MSYVAAGIAAASMLKGAADKKKAGEASAADKKAASQKENDDYFMKSFNTKLNVQEASDFALWKLEELKQSGKDWSKDMQDYDVQGFFKSGKTLMGGHGTDKFKKPNHSTFSNESMYSGSKTRTGKGVYEGGAWGKRDGRDTFTPHKSMFKNKTHDPETMSKYFESYESGSELIFPSMP